MKDEPSAGADPLITIELHESTAHLLSALLRALAELTEPGDDRINPGVRSYLMQALDSPADLDLLFSVLADTIEQVIERSK